MMSRQTDNPQFTNTSSLIRWGQTNSMVLKTLASQSIPTWNRIVAWLREIETLRNAAS
jgi:hypothetical protein